MAMAYTHDSKDGLAHRPSDPWATGVRPLSQSTGGDTKEIVRDDTFYYDHVVFLVEGYLFKVPKQKSVEGSPVFSDMFTLPAGTALTEGDADDTPVRLAGVKQDEFKALLHVMFRPSYSASAELSIEEWILVLKLTTMWQFHSLRCVALDKLKLYLPHLNEDPVRWLCLARQYDVDEWLLPSLRALARRPKAIQLEEVDLLGLKTVVKMAEVRESFRGCTGEGNVHRARSRHHAKFSTEIKRLFGEELERVKASSGVVQ